MTFKRALKKRCDTYWMSFTAVVESAYFSRMYTTGALVVLALSTLIWATQGAHLQHANADQLANPFLLENGGTFKGSLLPGAHNFFFKWPIFYLIKLFGYSAGAFTAVTVLTVFMTVGFFAYILYRLNRRPYVFGTLCIALSSVLFLIPAQPYAGGLLPTNMAMVTTRNIEYIVYICALILLLRARKITSYSFASGVSLLGLLIASDKLFMSLTLLGALLAIVVYASRKKWRHVSLSVSWLKAGVLAVIFSIVLTFILTKLHLLTIGGSGASSPYSLVHTIKNFVLGVVYGGLGLLTNFGANPAYDATTLRAIPAAISDRLTGFAGIGFTINFMMFISAFVMSARIIIASIRRKNTIASLDTKSRLSIALLWSSVAAFLVFVGSDHYYAVDSRYLTICMFALFVGAALYLAKSQWPKNYMAAGGIVIICGMVLSLPFTVHTTHVHAKALEPTNNKNDLIMQVMKQHKADVLLGDYWRVLPIKAASGSAITVTPLGGCTEVRDVLSSTAWQLNLRQHSFAYLLSLEKGLTDYPACTLDGVVAAYGKPNASVLVDGNVESPKEVLLFYDKGISENTKSDAAATEPSTVVPITLDKLPHTGCQTATIMNIVAHQDDDLLFLSPDLIHGIKAEHCIRSVFITAGDAGAGSFYWLSRETGSEAAYAHMLGVENFWIKRIVKMGEGQYVTIANPRGIDTVSLIFMHLPDGNPRGYGFAATNYETIGKLYSGSIQNIMSVDGQSSFSKDQLIGALSALMRAYEPAEIRTQSTVDGGMYPDHNDHLSTGLFAEAARADYDKLQFDGYLEVPIRYYHGYTVHSEMPNVSMEDLKLKEDAFFIYAQYDGSVCDSEETCAATSTVYNTYLRRQYHHE